MSPEQTRSEMVGLVARRYADRVLLGPGRRGHLYYERPRGDVRRAVAIKLSVLYTFSLTWARDGSLVFINFDQEGRRDVYSVAAPGGTASCLTCGLEAERRVPRLVRRDYSGDPNGRPCRPETTPSAQRHYRGGAIERVGCLRFATRAMLLRYRYGPERCSR